MELKQGVAVLGDRQAAGGWDQSRPPCQGDIGGVSKLRREAERRPGGGTFQGISLASLRNTERPVWFEKRNGE